MSRANSGLGAFMKVDIGYFGRTIESEALA
jgi:hypothetical protein